MRVTVPCPVCQRPFVAQIDRDPDGALELRHWDGPQYDCILNHLEPRHAGPMEAAALAEAGDLP
jgi:hypothetical protein